MRIKKRGHQPVRGLMTAGMMVLAAWTLGAAQDSTMSFFITGSSIGQGGNLGGLSGADAHCQKLADSVGAGGKTWRAYLSTQSPVVNARDRIGTGPWFNANKVLVASSLEALHDTNNRTTITSATGLTHRGTTVANNIHDIMTGSRFNGMAPLAGGADSTCSNWTSSDTGVSRRTIVGHHNRSGISSNMIPHSWNQAHVTRGCSQTNVQAGGGSGFFYCFALAPTSIRAGDLRGDARASSSTYLSAGRSVQADVVYRYTLDRESRVEVVVFDVEGSERVVLERATRGAGSHEVRWNGADAGGRPLPAGLYHIVLRR